MTSTSTNANLTGNERKVFVAYPYRLYPRNEYRALFQQLGKLFDTFFVFADETITSLHILKKITDLIHSSAFGIYDITGWNANVTLELGLALGLGTKVYIAINPTMALIPDTPSDLRGIDRIQYTSLGDFRHQLHAVLRAQIGTRGTIIQAADFPWSPIGQPKPTDLVYAAVFRDILVHLVPDPDRADLMTVDLSFRIDSRDWRSIDYEHAPWVHIDFLDNNQRRIEIQGSHNWVVAEFHANDSRQIYLQNQLLSACWSDVASVRVWAGGGYAVSGSLLKNLSPYMVLPRIMRVKRSLQRRLTHP